MSREEKNKFGNFVHEQRKKEDEILEICQDIFRNSRNELAVSMHFFRVHSVDLRLCRQQKHR